MFDHIVKIIDIVFILNKYCILYLKLRIYYVINIYKYRWVKLIFNKKYLN